MKAELKITIQDIYTLENLCFIREPDSFSIEELKAWEHLSDAIDKFSTYYNGYPNKNRMRKKLTVEL